MSSPSSSSSDSQSGEGASEPVDQSSTTPVLAPVDVWRTQLQEQTLTPKDLIDFFKQAAPPLFLLESARNPAELGESQGVVVGWWVTISWLCVLCWPE